MNKLWTNGHFAEDAYVTLDDAAALPASGAVIVTLKRWREHRAQLLVPVGKSGRKIGVLVEPTAVFGPVTDALGHVAAIIIPFAKFTDGRGYSLARRLREELHFKGQIRATGEVLIDQIPLMLRCGFDCFAISHAPTLRALESGHLPAIPEVYQNAARGRARTSARIGCVHKLDAAE